MPDEHQPFEEASELLVGAGLPALAGVPAPLATAVFKAISYLIAGAANVPAAWLHQQAQEIQDDTAARSNMKQALAAAATRKAVSDPAIVDRMMRRLLGDETRKQLNREAVARSAIEEIKASPSNTLAASANQNIDPDWLNAFSRYADDASGVEARQLWGKVLAAEIRRPGQLSRATMRFLAEVDPETARTFEELAPLIVVDGFLRDITSCMPPLFGKLLLLEEAGLVINVAGGVSHARTTTARGTLTIVEPGGMLVLSFIAAGDKTIDVTPLTKIGREIRDVLGLPVNLDALRAVVAHFRAPLEGQHPQGLLKAELYPGAPPGSVAPPNEVVFLASGADELLAPGNAAPEAAGS